MAKDIRNTDSVIAKLASTAKSLAKIMIQSRRPTIERRPRAGERLIVMGNGPSLADTMRHQRDELLAADLMAVNFAANAEEFYEFRPRYYVMADPVFFASDGHENVKTLWKNLSERVDWAMTLFVPAAVMKRLGARVSDCVEVQCFNPVGVEGFQWLEDAAYSSGRGMPRPRNVLIAAIMVGIRLGYKEIYLTGADHSWTKTLEVDEDNTVVSVQPHFYKDNDAEHSRVASVYKDVKLHDIIYSFYVAFKSYFAIERYARRHGIDIYNATPGSFIDAFRRKQPGDRQP